jgi:hypothetical protein
VASQRDAMLQRLQRFSEAATPRRRKGFVLFRDTMR